MKKDRSDKSSVDPEGVWRKVTQTITAYASRDTQSRQEKKTAALLPQETPRAPPRARADSPSKHAPIPLDSATKRKIKRGRMDIDACLDLHGMNETRAHAALSRFILEADAQGKRTLLIITGKGRAEGSGVLKRLVPLWLEERPLRGRVLSFSTASPKDGGEGALYVRLRRSK